MDTPAHDGSAPHRLRTTFLAGRQLIERAQAHLRAACEALRSAPRPDTRSEMRCDVLERLLEQLIRGVERYNAVAPAEFADARTQYSVEIPIQVDPPPVRAGLDETAAWALALTGRLQDVFSEMAETAPEQALAEIHANLAELMHRTRQRISLLEQGLRDL